MRPPSSFPPIEIEYTQNPHWELVHILAAKPIPWHYNKEQKLLLHRYLLNFSLRLCSLILFSDFKTYFSPLKVKNLHSNHSCLIFDFQLYLLQFFSNFQMLSGLHSLNLKLYSKQYNKKFVYSPIWQVWRFCFQNFFRHRPFLLSIIFSKLSNAFALWLF